MYTLQKRRPRSKNITKKYPSLIFTYCIFRAVISACTTNGYLTTRTCLDHIGEYKRSGKTEQANVARIVSISGLSQTSSYANYHPPHGPAQGSSHVRRVMQKIYKPHGQLWVTKAKVGEKEQMVKTESLVQFYGFYNIVC